MRAIIPNVEAFEAAKQLSTCCYSDDLSVLLQTDALTGMEDLASLGVEVNCFVTSPPYYGQRDYGISGSLGLEDHPSSFIEKLTEIFGVSRELLVENGSLWVNIGDTYWSGKGQSRGVDKKQPARRFGLRPQDKPGDGLWARPKQLLLIPHRLAISLQDDGWLVRNDNIWVKPNPLPDPVRDRCSVSHEHVFHFVKSRWYYFDLSSVKTATANGRLTGPTDTWIVRPSSGGGNHRAAYPHELIRIPIESTTPPEGIVLDPFVGTGTTMVYAKEHGLRSIGIELNPEYCAMSADALRATSKGLSK